MLLIRQKCKQYILKWDAVGSILKQTKGKHQLTIKTCIKYVDKKSPVMRPNLQPKIYKSPTLSHVCNYKVQFCAFKGDAQNVPLRRVGRGEISPQQFPEVNRYDTNKAESSVSNINYCESTFIRWHQFSWFLQNVVILGF